MFGGRGRHIFGGTSIKSAVVWGSMVVEVGGGSRRQSVVWVRSWVRISGTVLFVGEGMELHIVRRGKGMKEGCTQKAAG